MESAISLKTGDHLDAGELARTSTAYRATLQHLLVCPECGEPVHFKRREIPHDTPFFAHYKQVEGIKAIHVCSLRVLGTAFRPASQSVPGIRHGQLVDRFQREFCKALHDSFGRYSSNLYKYLECSTHERLTGRSYSNFLKALIENVNFSALTLQDLYKEENWLDEALDDVERFLRSSYGEWVGNFIHQVACFVAITLHPDIAEDDIGHYLFEIGNRHVTFVAEPVRLKNPVNVVATRPARQQRTLPRIAAGLVAHLILKWRTPSKVKGLYGVAEVVDGTTQYSPPSPKTQAPGDSSPTAIVTPPLTGQNEVSSQTYRYPWPRTDWSSSHPLAAAVSAKNEAAVVAAIRHGQDPRPRQWGSPMPTPIHQDQARPPKSWAPYSQVTQTPQSVRGPSSTGKPTIIYRKSPRLAPEPLDLTVKRLMKKFIPARAEQALPTQPPPPSRPFVYTVAEEEHERITNLISESRRLAATRPSTKVGREELLRWSGRKNAFEAYFLANILEISHDPPDFTDPTLSVKLRAWVQWARGH